MSAGRKQVSSLLSTFCFSLHEERKKTPEQKKVDRCKERNEFNIVCYVYIYVYVLCILWTMYTQIYVFLPMIVRAPKN